MKRTVLTFLLFLTVIALSSCGGGGDGATGSTPGNNNPSNGFNLVLTPLASNLPANTLGYPIFSGSPFLTQLNVRVTFSNGQIAPDGTIVNLSVDNVNVAFITVLDDPATTDVNEFTVATGTNNTTTSGGQAIFFINSNSQGTARFTASATSENRSYTGTLNYTITEGPDPTVQQLSAALPRTSLPVNNLSIPFFNGTPFMLEADLQFKDVFGNFTNPDVNVDGISVINVTISPANVLYFTTLDDLTTPDVNEFIAPEQTSGAIQMNAGHGNLFLWSRDVPGTATVTLSATEAGSGLVLTTSFNIDVVDDGSNPGQPSSISLNNNGGALYTNGSGGVTNKGINITVNSGNVPVLDPQVNNVKLSMVTDGTNSGEKLTGTNVNGAAVQGTSINIATTNGIANALVNSGSNSNTITVTATVDRADNNVDNGIQDGISAPTSYIVSDGVLWALDLTSPALDALTVNGQTNSDPGAAQITYDFQDGTYSLLISAIGTDKGGNPALPQTLQFGMINSPISGYPDNGAGSFVIAGGDGDPQEGGSSFSATSGAFITAAGGAQPGDTLLVFGEESLGNEDLESAVTVASVNSQTNLSIVEKFNRNDETGSINNDGGILPYAIGRAVDGNITATAVINDVGVASTRLNYPVSQLGRIGGIYVKGQGPVNNGVVKSVTDVSLITFPGVNGFNGQSSTLVASPSIIPGNRSVFVTVCLADSARNPLPGRFVGFSYAGDGNGSIDGISGTGTMANPTGVNGCTTGEAVTTGVLPGTTDGGFNFFAGNITCDLENSQNTNCIDVSAASAGVLNANPSSFIGRGSRDILLTLYDGSGTPIEGAAIAGSCDSVSGGLLSIVSGPGITNAVGQSSVTVSFALDAPGGGLSGTCTFATATGDPSVDVSFTGGDSCALIAPSPAAPSGACMMTDQFQVGGNVTGLTSSGPLVLQNNGANDITLTANSGFFFPLQDDGTTYVVTVQTQPPGQTCTVSNDIGTVSGADVTNVAVTCM